MRRSGRLLGFKVYSSRATIFLNGMIVCLSVAFSVLFVASSAAQTAQPPTTYPALPSETPARIEPVADSFDYTKRNVMIPMRDGVKLHTVIIVPKGAKGAPILLTRTPYDASALTSHARSAHLGPSLYGTPARSGPLHLVSKDPRLDQMIPAYGLDTEDQLNCYASRVHAFKCLCD